MVVILSLLVNLLCAIASCPLNFGEPGENSEGGIFSSNRRNSRDYYVTAIKPPIVYLEESSAGVEGYLMRSVSGRDIFAFEGIPFAEPPVGQLRFRPPIPKKSWSGVLPAKTSAPYCLQMHTFFLNRILGTEDCLQLNLYTPRIPISGGSSSDLLSVIIFFHGGAFQFGGAREYGPSYLLEKDVVLVVVNYRLGVLGFLSTGDEVSPGNNGLRDQELAIAWVHKNIEKFGGDKTRMTLLGQSGGASSVHYHMLSNRPTRNYFQRAISMSATSFNFWALQPPRLAKMWAAKAAKLANCPQGDSQVLIDCLRSINPVTLVSNQFHMQDYYPSYPSIMFGPTIEPLHPDAVITETAKETYDRDGASKIPFVISNTDAEGEVAIITLPTIFRFNQFRTQWKKLAQVFLDFKNIQGINQDEVTEAVEKFYFKNGTNSRTLPSNGFSNMTSDRYFAPGVYHGLQAHSKIAPTYSMVFSYRGRFGIPAVFGLDHANYRVGHSEDLFYVFNMSLFSQGLKVSQPEYQIATFMTDWIVNFANTGVPMNKTEEWPSIQDPNNIQQLSVDKDIRLTSYPTTSLEAIKFWDSLHLEDTKDSKNNNSWREGDGENFNLI